MLAGSVLVVRRKWPIAVVLVTIAVTPAEMGVLMGVVGLYTMAASELPRRIIGSLAGMSLLGNLVVTFVRLGQDSTQKALQFGDWLLPFASVTMSLGATAPPLLLGLYVGQRRRLQVVSWQHAAFLKPWNARLLRLRRNASMLWVVDSEAVRHHTIDRLGIAPERIATWPIFRAVSAQACNASVLALTRREAVASARDPARSAACMSWPPACQRSVVPIASAAR